MPQTDKLDVTVRPGTVDMPLSCIPAVVMQKVSQGPNWAENVDEADKAEIVQLTYSLWFANGMRDM
jgi:hypothetical protein